MAICAASRTAFCLTVPLTPKQRGAGHARLPEFRRCPSRVSLFLAGKAGVCRTSSVRVCSFSSRACRDPRMPDGGASAVRRRLFPLRDGAPRVKRGPSVCRAWRGKSDGTDFTHPSGGRVRPAVADPGGMTGIHQQEIAPRSPDYGSPASGHAWLPVLREGNDAGNSSDPREAARGPTRVSNSRCPL